MAKDDDLGALAERLIIVATVIGGRDDENLMATMTAAYLSGLTEDQRSTVRTILTSMRESADRGFALLEEALEKPRLKLVGK